MTRNTWWPPAGSPVCGPTERMWRFGQPSTAVSHALASLLSGASTAFLFAGETSTFSSDSSGSPLITADGDPIGWYQDLSGKSFNGTQSVTNNKALLNTNGGVRGAQCGIVSSQRRWIEVPVTLPAEFDMFYVFEKLAGPSSSPHFTFRTDANLSAAAAAEIYVYLQGADTLAVYDNSASSMQLISPITVGAPYYARIKREGGSLSYTFYNMDGTERGSASKVSTTSGAGRIYVGSDSYADYGPETFYFAMFRDSIFSAGELTTIHAAIQAAYNGVLS